MAGAAGEGSVSPADVYRSAVEEYRFQAQFNWSRTQYLLVFDTAILAAAIALGEMSGRIAALVFALGLLASAVSILVVRTQHDYYRAARDRMRRVESAVGIPEDQRADSTTGLGGPKRTASVNQLVYGLLAALGTANLVGAVVVLIG